MATLVKLPIVCGSSASLQFHRELHEISVLPTTDAPSSVFDTKTIQDFLDYKWRTDKYVSYFFAFIYLIFLITAIEWGSWQVLSAWFLFYFCINVMRVAWSPSKTPFADWAKSFWNWLELARLYMLMSFIVHLLYAEEYDETEVVEMHTGDRERLAYLVLLNVFGLLGWLRIWSRYRILLEFIRSSLVAVAPFLIVTLLMLVAFTFSYTYYQ
jgi:hypothetical protein